MIEIHAIHGFLGLPTDWNSLELPNLQTYDLTDPTIAPSSDGFWGWANRFNANLKNSSSSYPQQNRILVGYSLGGRLGMHALLANPKLWKGGVIISSHTGLKTEKEKMKWLQNDSVWAERFENEPWEKVLEAWNAKSVFAGVDFPIARKENQFSRKSLGDQLRYFSRGYQDDLSASIQNFDLPILWICGKLDHNFHTAAHELNFSHPLSRVEIVEDAAHRVPWEQPEKFIKLINEFTNEVSSCL